MEYCAQSMERISLNGCGGFYEDSSIVCRTVLHWLIYTPWLLHLCLSPEHRQRPLNRFWGQALLGCSFHHWWPEQPRISICVSNTHKQRPLCAIPSSLKSRTTTKCCERGEVLSCAVSPVRQMSGRKDHSSPGRTEPGLRDSLKVLMPQGV